MAAASGVKSCLFRVGPKRTVTGEGAAVGLNGGFLHTARPGANCLSRPEIPEDVSYEKAPRVPQGRKAEKVSGNRYGGNVGAFRAKESLPVTYHIAGTDKFSLTAP